MYKATEEQIKAWKEKYEAVFRITCKERELAAYCRNPTRQELSFISTIKDSVKFNEALLKNCWLEGDDKIQTSDTVFMGLAPQIAQLMHSEEVILEKL